jgi:hypothetical protein
MSTEHTPGPWYMETYTGHKPNADRGDWCGTIYSKEGIVYHGPFSFHALPKKADARLIRAAPDLLTACEDAIKIIELWPESEWGWRDQQAHDVLSAVIAKAREP